MFSPSVFIVINDQIKDLRKQQTAYYRSKESDQHGSLGGIQLLSKITALNNLKKALRKAGIKG